MRMQVFVGAAMTLSSNRLEAEITEQVTARGAGKTICPSEVARALAEDWRGLMVDVRGVAGEMVARGEIVVTQKGRVIEIETARGPIRLGLP